MKKRIKRIIFVLFTLFPTGVLAAYEKRSCGNASQGLTNFPLKVAELTTLGINLIQVAVPVVIILLGMIDLIKAVSSGKEEDIKKGQNILIKRLITGGIIFFVFVIVKLIISLVSDQSSGIIDCMECFINYSTCTK